MEKYIAILAEDFKLRKEHVENIINLLEEGNTIPFIARYRKELTGSVDDQTLRALSERYIYLQNLDTRRNEIYKLIDEQGKMTDELRQAIENASILAELEDIYRPYKPKRRTRATIAKEKGLEPLAETIFAQEDNYANPEGLAATFIDIEKGVENAEDALNGAMDIIAEWISDNASVRKAIREYTMRYGKIESTAASEEDSVYSTYYEFSSQVDKLQSHQTLAINRGEREGFLKVAIRVDESITKNLMYRRTIKGEGNLSEVVRKAADDAYSRLIFPSIEREVRKSLTEQADEQAIRMFSMNLNHLLMQPPLKGKTVMGLDPAYRTGCKIAVVDETGRLLDTSVVYPTPPQNRIEDARRELIRLIEKHGVEVIAIGNGTASRESEIFVADMISDNDLAVSYMVVSEAGASVYSASKLAAEEFPEYDVSLRSAVSIARRLQDPLAELVKIDPKAIGVGQYQHDLPQTRLGDALKGVVEDSVNKVGVDLNTASVSLLSYISGISATVAKNIVAYRDKEGRFARRSQLLKVPKLGPKTYEQCAGFLRVPESENVLDNTAVHPESYEAAKKMLTFCGITEDDIRTGKVDKLGQKVEQVGLSKVAEHCGIGIPTLQDIINELQKPGRDPRDELPKPILRKDVLDISDLKPGMKLRGTVRNVIDFGAFVDIGVHQDGLVHISKLADRFIKHPSEVVKVGDQVEVTVLTVDVEKKRISLSMRD
jgi:uncharacterized protein